MHHVRDFLRSARVTPVCVSVTPLPPPPDLEFSKQGNHADFVKNTALARPVHTRARALLCSTFDVKSWKEFRPTRHGICSKSQEIFTRLKEMGLFFDSLKKEVPLAIINKNGSVSPSLHKASSKACKSAYMKSLWEVFCS